MKMSIAIILAVILSGCAVVPQRPIVDMQSVKDSAKFESDVQECQAYAAKPVDNTGNHAMGSAVVGAGLGALFGDRHTAGVVGLLAGLEGLANAAQADRANRESIVRECLKGRGYSVLGSY